MEIRSVRRACHQLYPGSGGHHAGGRRGHHPLSPAQATGGPRLYRRRLHHRPAHPALRPDPRRRHHQDPRRTRGDLPDVLPGPGVQPRQAVQGGRHGLHSRLPGNRPDDLDRLRDRPLVRLEHHGLAVPRRDPGDFLDHHHRQGAQRPEDEERALRPADLRRADRRGHPRHRYHRPALGHRRQRHGQFRRSVLHGGQALAVHDRRAGGGHPPGAAPAGLRGEVRKQRNAPDHRARPVLRLLPAGVKLEYSMVLGAFLIGAIMAESRQLMKIERLIEPVRDLFSAIFFVAIGLMIDPAVLVEYIWPIVVITIAVVLGKMLSCGMGAFIAGNDGRHQRLPLSGGRGSLGHHHAADPLSDRAADPLSLTACQGGAGASGPGAVAVWRVAAQHPAAGRGRNAGGDDPPHPVAEGADLGPGVAAVAAVPDCRVPQAQGAVDAAGGNGGQAGNGRAPYPAGSPGDRRGDSAAVAAGDLPAAVRAVGEHPAHQRAIAADCGRCGWCSGAAVALVHPRAHAHADCPAGDTGEPEGTPFTEACSAPLVAPLRPGLGPAVSVVDTRQPDYFQAIRRAEGAAVMLVQDGRHSAVFETDEMPLGHVAQAFRAGLHHRDVVTLRGQQQGQRGASGVADQFEIPIAVLLADLVQGLVEAVEHGLAEALVGPHLRVAGRGANVLAGAREVEAGLRISDGQAGHQQGTRAGVQARLRGGGPGVAVAFEVDTQAGAAGLGGWHAHGQREGAGWLNDDLVGVLGAECLELGQGELAAGEHD
ncbi:hypothetical protein L1887_51794 [Cichorium endivia]|nr:hypothetical protein L1887_51794 [Cichorium endivia]